MTHPDHVVVIGANVACLICKLAIRSKFGPVLHGFIAKHTHAAASA